MYDGLSSLSEIFLRILQCVYNIKMQNGRRKKSH